MDQLITIIIVLAVSAVATLLKKMKQSEERPEAPPFNRPRQPRPQSAPQPQRPTTSWEDELRRLLGDESAPPPPAPRLPPPPTIVPTVPAPAPIIRSTSPMQPRSRPQPAPRPRVIITSAARTAPERVPTQPAVAQAAMLTEAQQAYQQVAPLNQETSSRVDRIALGRVPAAAVERRPPSAELAQALALFKNARTARQAVIASIILGPPPALEPSSTLF